MRERYPDTPAGELRLFPRLHRYPRGTRPMDPGGLSRIMRRWVDALPTLLDRDGEPFDGRAWSPTRFATATPSATPTTAPRSRCCAS